MKTFITVALAAMLAAGSAAASNHDRPVEGDISMDDARRVAEREGYTNIVQIEFDDGQWEIDTVDSDGIEVDIDIDAASGEVVRVDRD